LTPDAGFDSFLWDIDTLDPFSAKASSSSTCEDLTCVADISFSPTKSGSFFRELVFRVTEEPDGPEIESGALFETGIGVVGVSNTPLPATLPLFATGLGALGLLGWRRKRMARVSLLGVA